MIRKLELFGIKKVRNIMLALQMWQELYQIIESIPSKNAEPIKQWLAKLGSERIDEVFDPSIAMQRSIDLYRSKGYDENWIAKRMKAIQNRKQLTDVWKENGIEDAKEYAIKLEYIIVTGNGEGKQLLQECAEKL